jgi:hypothetical protein
MKLTRKQAAEYLTECGFKYKGRFPTYRTLRTMTDNGLIDFEKVDLGDDRFIYMFDTDVLDELIDEMEDGDE